MTQDAFLASPKADAKAPFVLDVRTPEEYVAGHVPGAVNIPHDQVAARLAEVPKDKRGGALLPQRPARGHGQRGARATTAIRSCST